MKYLFWNENGMILRFIEAFKSTSLKHLGLSHVG